MDEAEKKRLHEYFEKRYADLNDRYRELLQQPLVQPGEEVDWDCLNHVSYQLVKQAVLYETMYQLEGPSAKNMEHCMNDVFNLLREVNWNVHPAVFNTEPTLGKIIRTSMQDISDGVYELVHRAIGCRPYEFSDIRDRVIELSAKVSNLYKAVHRMPKTDVRVTALALVRVAKDIRRAIGEMEREEGSSNGKPGEEASTSNAGGEEEDVSGKKYTPEEQRAITELVIRLASGAVEVIKVLMQAVTDWDNNNVVVAITHMEDLLASSTRMRDQVNGIKGCLFPIRRVPKILEALDHINASVGYAEQNIYPYGHRSVLAFHENATVLTNAIEELKIILTNQFPTRVSE